MHTSTHTHTHTHTHTDTHIQSHLHTCTSHQNIHTYSPKHTYASTHTHPQALHVLKQLTASWLNHGLVRKMAVSCHTTRRFPLAVRSIIQAACFRAALLQLHQI